MLLQRLIGKLRNPNCFAYFRSEIIPSAWIYVLIISIISILKFINLGSFDLQSWDEALYAVRAKSIIYFGAFWDQSYFSPEGLYSASHPPLYVWLTALSYSLFGVNEFSARFFSALFSIGITIVIFFSGKLYYDSKTGFFAALLIIFNPFFNFWSMQGQFDIALTFFTGIAFYMYLLSGKKESFHLYLLTGLFIGLALLTKLFVGSIVIFSIILFEILNRDERNYQRIVTILLTSALIALPWHLFMILEHSGSDFLFFFKQSQMFERAFSGIENNSKELGFFFFLNQSIVYFPLFVVPFIFYIFFEAKKVSRNLFVIWFLLYFLIISAVSTKLPVYLLLLLIPLSLVATNSLMKFLKNYTSKREIFLFLTSINLLVSWSLSNEFRTMFKNIFRGNYSNFSQFLMNYWWIFAFFFLIESVIFYASFSSKKVNLLPLVLGASLSCYFAIYLNTVLMNTYEDLDSGIEHIVDYINHNPNYNVIAVGHGINPQFSFYSDGLDIGWQKEKSFRRLDPENGYEEIYNYLLSNEFKNTYIIYEKSDFYLRNLTHPDLVIPVKFKSLIETNEYILYSAENNK